MMTWTTSTLRACASAIAALLLPLAAHAAAPAKPYNVIFVLVDDLRFDGMGFLTPGLKTPNIDFLAKNGVYFPNAVVTSSLCSPSRATILTGQSTRNHGVVDNNNASEEGLVFFPRYLQESGYQTAFFGKWHMGASTDAPRAGFDKWVSFKGQGTYSPTEGLTPHDIAAGKRQTLNVDGKIVDRKTYMTDELSDHELDWLENGRDTSKPFFIFLSHKAVHFDAVPAARHRGQYANLDIQMPASMADTPENNRGKPMWVQNQRNSWHGIDFPYHARMDFRAYFKTYFETLSAVDDNLGRTLAYLRRNKLENSTLIVFTSDNGFLKGEHGLIDKRNAYEPSVRVPMVAYAPGLLPKGVTNPVRVRNLDLAPTFLDVAGATPPPQFEGKSVLPVATGAVAVKDWTEDDFIYEYYWEWTFPQTPTTFAIQRGRLKYIQYHGVWDLEELYDLSQDPEEMNNLIHDKAYAAERAELRRALFKGLATNSGRHAVPYTEKSSAGLGLRDREGDKAADFPPEWQVTTTKPDPVK